MKQNQTVLSTYSVDLFGVCSALYELGGLVIMHDASGCNSTYGTHNEPRWYHTPSMVYVSKLREIDTIYGNDRRLINDIKEVADEVHPPFIAIGGSPMPNAIGTDLKGVGRLIEKETGIPTLGIRTDGMHSYIPGAGEAFRLIAERFLIKPETPHSYPRTGPIRVNLLGVTPLDFSVVGNVTTLKEILKQNDIHLQSCWAMGSSLDSIRQSAAADVNAVVASSGLAAAQYMEKHYGIPYVVGLPAGQKGCHRWLEDLHRAAEYGESNMETAMHFGGLSGLSQLNAWKNHQNRKLSSQCDVLVLGEPVFLSGVSDVLQDELKIENVRLVCPMPDAPGQLTANMDIITLEDELREACRSAKKIIADPIYARLLPDHPEKFVALPHEAYSGRTYREEIPVFVGETFTEWLRSRLRPAV